MEYYEYAGFIFEVVDGKIIRAKPGQHQAAYKDKHRQAAQQCYDEDAGDAYAGVEDWNNNSDGW